MCFLCGLATCDLSVGATMFKNVPQHNLKMRLKVLLFVPCTRAPYQHAVTLAMMEGSYNRRTQLLPKEDVVVVIWGTKSPATFSIPSDFKQASKWPGNIWAIRRRTRGQTNNSTKLIGSIWIWHLKTNPTCTKFGDPNRTLVSAAPECRWDCIRELHCQTRGVQIAAEGNSRSSPSMLKQG